MFDEILKNIDFLLPKDKDGNFKTEEEKSDVVHDFLAYLAKQMIEMNKEKNKEIKGFLEWLEGTIKIKIENLSGKTKLREYYKHDFDEIRRVFEKNKKLFEFDPKRREFLELVKDEFDKSILKLKPLLERIKATDNLIDQIVYKLYGLTDDEIRIVEESLQ
ncbi:MAG: hypothetical protein ACE5K0_08645 [Candidatus Methanofastidiosia archaeon]